MTNKHSLFMLASFIFFFILYFLFYKKYSNIIGLVYIALMSLQALIFYKSERRLSILLPLFFLGILCWSLFSQKSNINHPLSVYLLCGFVVILGYICTCIPYNAFLGIRIFSTRNSENNWKRTHAVLGNLSIPISCLIFILSKYFEMNIVITIAFSIWLIIPIIYSIRLYYKKGVL